MRTLDKHLSSNEAARLLGTSREVLRTSRKSGTLIGLPSPKHLLYGETVRYKEATLKKWLDNFNSIKEVRTSEH